MSDSHDRDREEVHPVGVGDVGGLVDHIVQGVGVVDDSSNGRKSSSAVD